MLVLAHGSAGRTDLPISLAVFAYLAAMAVLLVWAATNGRTIRLDWPARDLTRPWAIAARVAGVVALVAVVVSAWHGDLGRTSTPHALVFIGLWVALPATAALFGDVWRWTSPWDLAVAPTPAPLRAPTHWPAAIGMFAYVWLFLVRHPDRPEVVGTAVVAYAVVMLVAAARRGRAWLRTGDAFAVWSSMAAGIRRLHEVDVRPGTRAFLAVPVGAVLLDAWDRESTLLLLACVVVAAIAMRTVDDVRALVPVAVSWFVAMYLSLLLLQGQVLIAVASDPFGRGWDLFGTADRAVSFTIIGDTLFVALQWTILAAGHAVGVLVDRSRRTTLALIAGSVVSVVLLLGR
jgi:hypothetical protein